MDTGLSSDALIHTSENFINPVYEHIEAFIYQGIEPDDYDGVMMILNQVRENHPNHTDALRVRLRKLVASACESWWPLAGSLVGWSAMSPLGRGDFWTIRNIYAGNEGYRRLSSWIREIPTMSPTEAWEKWDAYFMQNPATETVRRRKDYTNERIREILKQKAWKKKLLVIGSWPATDVIELLQSLGYPTDVHITGIDHTQSAIEYATRESDRELGDRYCRSHLQFVRANVLKYLPTDEEYDIILSSWVNDYFSHATSVSFLARLEKILHPEWTLLLGNFSSYNPSRWSMEVITDWRLYHRTERDLRNIAFEAGITEDQINIGKVPSTNPWEEINLFLEVQK